MYRIVFLIINNMRAVLQNNEFLLRELSFPAELLLYRIKTGEPP